MGNNPVITAVTHIDAPPEKVWRVLTDFAGYAEWHPVLRFVDVPAEILPGTRLQAQLTRGAENDGAYEFTVVDHEAPERLAWTGGIPDVLTGLHSFVLEPHDGGTRFTESEEFTGSAAVETIEPARAQMEEGSASYVRALKKRVESGH
ncbi:SRPBCC domain-containing protein [Streptomyces phaeochromogenes]|uniref:SRPBCC domain-containing protein n=1 Tax=Streptomyces phaeochromogenes TaxID=1923 RepID=A0ABZ1H6Z6_STRPH|nr:SRPBCC domain-containing protein [Streptomyces phaeochromogenes]WSD14323.1 SRPBCC domain-containing protein [Streptomyces phaeochromogenes]